MRQTASLIGLIGIMALASGCITSTQPDVPKTDYIDDSSPAPVPDHLLQALSGRHIAIDPGHGGPWPGAVAPSNGLREADVNLQVSRALTSILESAGARVTLTRTADMALVDSGLSADLAKRAELADEAEPAAFISVHHNADIVPNSQKNYLEVYYALRDDIASRDLGRHLTHALATRFRRDADRKLLLPGNYKVLRQTTVPAVLLESAYLTHGPSAARLATEAGVRAEATAIAAGLGSYFATEPPQISQIRANTDSHTGLTTLDAKIEGAPINAASVDVSDNGVSLEGYARISGKTLHWTGREPIMNGIHELRLSVRNIHGSGASAAFGVHVNREAATLTVHRIPSSFQPDSSGHVKIEARLRDRFGLAAADGVLVTCQNLGLTRATRNGTASFHLPARQAAKALRFESGTLSAELGNHTGKGTWKSIILTDSSSGNPIKNAALIARDRSVSITDEAGWSMVNGQLDWIQIDKAGYQSKSARLDSLHNLIELEPTTRYASGTIIYLDPLDGGRHAGMVGPSGMRASDAAEALANDIGQRLEAAGATVILSRAGDEEKSELNRIAEADEAGAQLYIAVTFGIDSNRARLMDDDGHQVEAPANFVAHYPGSRNGALIAEHIAEFTGIESVLSSVYYPVQQVASPAVLVQPASISDAQVEEQLLTNKMVATAGQSIFDGIMAALSTMKSTAE